MRRVAGSAAVVAALVVLTPLCASATWTAPGTGAGTTVAATVSKPAAPTVVKSGANAQVSWTASTLTNGTAATGYTVLRHNGATTTTVCTTTAPTVTCNDTSPVYATVTYGVVAKYKGWTGQESNTTSFRFDNVAPVTTASATGTPNAAGWTRAASANVTLTATDADSGVASIWYKVGSASPVTVNAATTTFTVNAQGATVITYRATDVAGNVEADKTLTVRLDNVAPPVAMTFPNTNGAFNATSWGTNCRDASNTPIAGICGTAVDAASGTDTVQYELSRPFVFFWTQCWNGTSWSINSCGTWRDTDAGPTAQSWVIPIAFNKLGSGPFELTILATDVAGNTSPTANPTDTWN